jgi:hypothetical protein
MRSIDVRLRKLEATGGYRPLVAFRFIDDHEGAKTHAQEYLDDDLVISRIVISAPYQRLNKTMGKQI